MKIFWYSVKLLSLALLISTALFTVFEFTGAPSIIKRLNYPATKYNQNESYDPAFQRLSSVEKLAAYCDSLFAVKKAANPQLNFETSYPLIVSEVIRQRFYHGMSSFGFGNNYLGYMINGAMPGMLLNAPVMANDILKYPYAICSQQAIVGMRVLEARKFLTRKVGFDGSKVAGHFCYEAFYAGQWHFFDTDMEPDANVLFQYGRPGIKFLVDNPEIIQRAYSRMEPKQVMTIFGSYFYGKPDEILAPKATFFQQVTKILSYTLWIFFLFTFLFASRKYSKITNPNYVRNRWFSLSKIQQGRPTEDYQVYGPSGA